MKSANSLHRTTEEPPAGTACRDDPAQGFHLSSSNRSTPTDQNEELEGFRGSYATSTTESSTQAIGDHNKQCKLNYDMNVISKSDIVQVQAQAYLVSKSAADIDSEDSSDELFIQQHTKYSRQASEKVEAEDSEDSSNSSSTPKPPGGTQDYDVVNDKNEVPAASHVSQPELSDNNAEDMNNTFKDNAEAGEL